MYTDKNKITFDRALDVLRQNQKPNSSSNLLLNILGLNSGNNSEELERVADAIQIKISEALHNVGTRIQDINANVHRKPWKFVPMSLGIGFMAGLSIVKYRRRHKEMQVEW